MDTAFGAKIQFRIRDKDKNAVDRVSMVMQCKLNNGKSWRSQKLQETKPGMIWLDIPDKIFNEISLKSVKYKITAKGKSIANSATKPHKRGRSTYRVNVTLKR